MITIWHQTNDTITTDDPIFFESGLIPIAVVNTNSLSIAADVELESLEFTSPSQRIINYSVEKTQLIDTPGRNNTVGDILYKFDRGQGECWQISESGLVKIEYFLPHVGVSINPEIGDPIEDFPTLDLQLCGSTVLDTVNLPEFSHGWSYLETRCWAGITIQNLLRTYK